MLERHVPEPRAHIFRWDVQYIADERKWLGARWERQMLGIVIAARAKEFNNPYDKDQAQNEGPRRLDREETRC